MNTLFFSSVSPTIISDKNKNILHVKSFEVQNIQFHKNIFSEQILTHTNCDFQSSIKMTIKYVWYQHFQPEI